MTSVSVIELEKAAGAGDPQAMTALGKLALIGGAGSRSPQDALALFAGAAEAGDAEADCLIAVLIGANAKAPAQWAQALDYLGRAGARGWEPARQQLGLLCHDHDLVLQSKTSAPPADIWRRMRDSIDTVTLTTPTVSELQFGAPRIGVIAQFASKAECDWMIAKARPHIARAKVFDRGRGGGVEQEARTNSTASFNILNADVVLMVLRARIAAATGLQSEMFEETNVLHYATGQEFLKHYDFLDPAQAGLEDEIAKNGQRAVTFLIYLNDDFEGGETEFVKLGWRFRGRPGDALVFSNVDASGAPDRQTLHAGLAPSQGEKWLLSQWIRLRVPSPPS